MKIIFLILRGCGERMGGKYYQNQLTVEYPYDIIKKRLDYFKRKKMIVCQPIEKEGQPIVF